MSISKVGAIVYPKTEYTTGRTKNNAFENSLARQNNNVQKSQMPEDSFVLHYFDNEEGERAISASCGTDYSVTVYEPKDYDPAAPVYKVKIWDKDGNVTDRMVDVTKVDPKNSDYIDMYAYSCYVSGKGDCPGALSSFMGADTGCYGPDGRTYKDLFTLKNWVKAVGDMMQMQYDAGNLQGYLDYKKFYDFLIKDGMEKKASGTEDAKSEPDESESRTEVVVKPDGSKVLIVTIQSGGMQKTMSVELSKPTEMPNDSTQNDSIQNGSIINDSVKNTVMGDIK